MDFSEAGLKSEMAVLSGLLGDMRMRFHQRKTPFLAADKLIDLDLQIRNALHRPLSAQLELDVRRLTTRLRALDPH